MTTYVYDFAQGTKDQADLLGGKGANLAEMTRLGLPVPPGFIVSTDACRVYLAAGAPPAELDSEVGEHLRRLEHQTGRRLGDTGAGGGPISAIAGRPARFTGGLSAACRTCRARPRPEPVRTG
jgi:Pyruvate phosphate dikinase, AMP/ATP-binding domain